MSPSFSCAPSAGSRTASLFIGPSSGAGGNAQQLCWSDAQRKATVSVPGVRGLQPEGQTDQGLQVELSAGTVSSRLNRRPHLEQAREGNVSSQEELQTCTEEDGKRQTALRAEGDEERHFQGEHDGGNVGQRKAERQA